MASSSRPLAVITGASSGIGEQFARRYAREGYDLVVVARSRGALHSLADDVGSRHGAHVDVHTADLADAADVAVLAEKIERGLPRVDVLVNCAGVSPDGDLARADEAELRRLVDINVVAVTFLTRAAIVRMRERGSGTIINVGSVAGHQPMPHLAAYSASKAYVLALSEALSEENRSHGVRIFAVSPGDTETPMNPGAARTKRRPEQVVETAWRATGRRAPSVVDGGMNTAFAALTTRLLPKRTGLRIAERLMRDRA